ncbi:hypothetical protein V502_01764 [Pseudogymnoascus sp. VKM F-4520 (FW-2644)]|nr:hypothetical protein V502_01764 [Pseudogymnoascus sp. VKM F-4520 (FW-2644)]
MIGRYLTSTPSLPSDCFLQQWKDAWFESVAQQQRGAPLRGQQLERFYISEADLLSFSIAESAEIFFERNVPSPQGPPVLAPLTSNRAESSPARPARRERQTRRGHTSLVQGYGLNQTIPSAQQRWSTPLGGCQPAAPGPSHHVTPNERGTSSASHAIRRQDLWTDITRSAEPCFSISLWEDQQNRRFREMDENDPKAWGGGELADALPHPILHEPA